MRTWLTAVALVAAIPASVPAQNTPTHDGFGPGLLGEFQDMKWEKTNPEQGSNSPEVAVVHQDAKETELFSGPRRTTTCPGTGIPLTRQSPFSAAPSS